MSAFCWVAAALLSESALTTPSQRGRAPAEHEQAEEDGEEEADAALDQPHG